MQGTEEVSEVCQGHTQTNYHQNSSQHDSTLHMMHIVADTGAGTKDCGENNGRSPHFTPLKNIK